VTIEAILDVCRHIVSTKGWGPVAAYIDFVKLMAERNVITRRLAEKLEKFVRWRNIIVHRYLEIDYEELYEDSSKLESIVSEFEKQIANYLKKL
jgi:uncharacterized protein YutE (UPF0331/DUF86 family)